MRRLRVGVVGSGIGASHIEGYRALPDHWEVAALCDVDPVRGGEVAARFGLPLDGRIEDTFARDLDVIDVSTPSWLHFEQATAALDAGFDVVVEKPVARSLAEIDALAATAARTGRRVCPIFQYRFGRGLQRLRHLRSKGLAGAPLAATAETHWFRDASYYGRAPWRGTWDGETGGCLTTHAIHIHDLLCELLGRPVSVHARTSRMVNGNETEDMAVLSLAFDGGALASSSVTLGSRQQTSRLRIVFRDLVAESGLDPYNPGHDPWTFPHDDPEAARRIEDAMADFVPAPERFPGQFLAMHAGLVGEGPLPVTLDDARRSIELLAAAYHSAHTGEAVALPLGPEHPFYGGWIETMKRVAAHG